MKSGQYNDSDLVAGLSAGDTLTYTFDVTNTGDTTITGVVINEDAFDLPGPIVITPPADIDLSPSEAQQWTGSYTLTQADIDNTFASADGDVDNLASATGTDPAGDPVTSNQDPAEIPLPAVASLSIVKSAVVDDNDTPTDPLDDTDWQDDGDGIPEAGDTIIYSYVVTNDGNVTLSNVDVSDAFELPALTADLGPITCDDVVGGDNVIATMAPGDVVNCTADYTVSQADIDVGAVGNTATAVGTDPAGDPVSDTDDEEVTLPQNPAHTLTKNFVTEFLTNEGENQIGEGETATFELLYTNTGNVSLYDIVITDTVDRRLVIDDISDITTDKGSCTLGANQFITCTLDGPLSPGESVMITVEFLVLGEALLPSIQGQDSGATYVVYFENGYVLYGSTYGDGSAVLLDENRDPAVGWDIDSLNQDIFLTVPYGGGPDGGFQLHLSCSEPYINGWGATGPLNPAIHGVNGDDPDWRVISYTVERFNTNGLFKDCKQTFRFDVENEAFAEATPAGGEFPADTNPVRAEDTLVVVNIAPIEITRDRFRRGAVEIQYFNTSFEALDLDIIQVEWQDRDMTLLSASYQDGLGLGISGCGTLDPAPCLLSASIDTTFDARSKDWLKLSFVDSSGKKAEPENLKVTIVTDDGATFSYIYNETP